MSARDRPNTCPRQRLVLVGTTLFLLVTARLGDIAITFHVSPDLSLEGNPIVILVKGGPGTILFIVATFSILAIVSLIVFWRGPSLASPLREMSLCQYVRFWLRQVAFERQPFTSYLPRGSHANQGLQAIQLFGLALPWCLIFGSLNAVYAWFQIWVYPNPSFEKIYSSLHIGRAALFPSIVAFLGLLFGTCLFFWTEHQALVKIEKGARGERRHCFF